LPREKINLNIDVSTTVVQAREVKLPFLKCEAFVDVMQKGEDDSQELEPVRGWIEVEVRDSKGEVVQSGKHRMHSLLNNFLRVLDGEARATGGVALSTYGTITSATVTGLDGLSKTIAIEWYSSRYSGGGTTIATNAGDNDASYGIIVGSGTDPVDLNNYKLSSPIPHGTGAGQLDYDAMSVVDLGLDTSVSPPVYRIRLIRGFKNLSGGDVTINEVGLVACNFWEDFDANRNPYINYDVKFLIARDVLPQSYVVPDGGSATVTITVEVVMG